MKFERLRAGKPTDKPSETTGAGNEIQQLSPTQKLTQAAIKVLQRVSASFERNHFFPKQARRLSKQLDNPELILDIGSSKGYLGDALQSAMPKTKVISTDVCNDHQGHTPFVVASGDALPFADKTFDASTLFYVLHHFDRPGDALQEAKRVSKKIIVQEDTYRNKWQKWWYELHVNSYQLNSSKYGTSVKTDAEWHELFEREGLTVTEKRRVRKVGYPVTRYEYQLEPTTVFPSGK